MNNQSPLFQEKYSKVIFLIVFFYILPPIAIFSGIIPFSIRFVLLTAITPVLFFVRPSSNTNNFDLGITKKNFLKSIFSIIPFTLILGLLIFLAASGREPRYDNTELSLYFYLFYVLISCPFQEFVYRGYLFHALDILQLGKWVRIIIAALLYSFVHIIYNDVYILIATLIAGILWNIHYDKFRSLAGVIVSHIIIGILTITSGLI